MWRRRAPPDRSMSHRKGESDRMTAMPKLVRPDDQPPALEDFIAIFGNRARLSIISYLLKSGPSMRVDIAKGTEIAIPTLGHHLTDLERIGVLDVDLPPERRRGRSVHYAANRERLDELKMAHEQYLFGDL